MFVKNAGLSFVGAYWYTCTDRILRWICFWRRALKVEALPPIMEAHGSSGDLVEARRLYTIAQNLKNIFLMLVRRRYPRYHTKKTMTIPQQLRPHHITQSISASRQFANQMNDPGGAEEQQRSDNQSLVPGERLRGLSEHESGRRDNFTVGVMPFNMACSLTYSFLLDTDDHIVISVSPRSPAVPVAMSPRPWILDANAWLKG